MTEQFKITTGSTVRTQFSKEVNREDWTEHGWERKQWGVEGVVTGEHNSHGLCYAVRHEDGTSATYDPFELEVIDMAQA